MNHSTKVTLFFFTVIQYTMLQYAYCNALLLCSVDGTESLAAVLLSCLSLSQRLVSVSEIDDILANMLPT